MNQDEKKEKDLYRKVIGWKEKDEGMKGMKNKMLEEIGCKIEGMMEM